jgi:hypothetical protein
MFSHLSLPLLHCPLLLQHDLQAHVSDNPEEFWCSIHYLFIHFCTFHHTQLTFHDNASNFYSLQLQKWITENINRELQSFVLTAQVWSKQKDQCLVLPLTVANPDPEVRSRQYNSALHTLPLDLTSRSEFVTGMHILN